MSSFQHSSDMVFGNDPDPFVESRFGIHRSSCEWSDDNATLGPDTCNCCMEDFTVDDWLHHHLSPGVTRSRFGVHWENCPLNTGDRNAGNLHFCTCNFHFCLIQALTKFTTENITKTDLQHVISQMQTLSERLVEATKILPAEPAKMKEPPSIDGFPLPQCCANDTEAEKWIHHHVSPDLMLTRSGVHLKNCSLNTEDRNAGNLSFCTCYLSLIQVLKKFMTDNITKTDLQRFVSQMQTLSRRLVEATNILPAQSAKMKEPPSTDVVPPPPVPKLCTSIFS